MKKFFTLIFATMMATQMMAQMHSAMSFVGASKMQVSSMNLQNESDTVKFELASMASGNITLPSMKGMQTIPSFTIENVKFSMGANHEVTMDDQTFSSQVTVNGEVKDIKGSSLTGAYNMADNSLTITAVFTCGVMPLPMTYSVKAYFVKPVTNAVNVNVGGMVDYVNNSVTYQVRKYVDGDVEKVDVEIPAFGLENTMMGDLTLGTYTVKGLTYDAEMGGFYRDYKNDGLSFHFKAVSNGVATMDGEYNFGPTKENNILVVYNGNQIDDIVNHFQMGSMPFAITSTFKKITDGISSVKDVKETGDGKVYNLSGQEVSNDYKGIVIKNGKKYLMK